MSGFGRDASHEGISRQIAYALVGAAKKKGIGQKELASEMGVHQTTLSKIKNGDRKLSLADFFALCEAVGVAPSEALEMRGESSVPHEVRVRGRIYRLVG